MTITGNFDDCFLEDVQKLQEEGFPAFDVDLFANMGQLCRVCARRHDDMVPIFSERGQQLGVDKMIHSHLPIKVTKYDKLPVQLCPLCIEKLLVCEMLVAECSEADKKLNAMLTMSRAANDKVLTHVEDDCRDLLLDSEIAPPNGKITETATDQMSGEAEMLAMGDHGHSVDSLMCGTPCELMLDASDPITELSDASFSFYSDCGEDHCGSLESSPTWSEILQVAEITEREIADELSQQNLHQLGETLGTDDQNKKSCSDTNTVEMMDDSDITGLELKVDSCELNAAVGNVYQNSCHEKSADSKNNDNFTDTLSSVSKPSVEVIPSNFEGESITCISIPKVNVNTTMKILTATETMDVTTKDASVAHVELLSMPDEDSVGNYSFITDLDSMANDDIFSSIDGNEKVLELSFQQQFAPMSVTEDLSRASDQVVSVSSTSSGVLPEPLDSSVTETSTHTGSGKKSQQPDLISKTNKASSKSQTKVSEKCGSTLAVSALIPTPGQGVKTTQIPVIKVLPNQRLDEKVQDKCQYDSVKVKRASRVNMIVLKAEHLQKELPQATIMANILEAVQKMNLKQQQKMTNKAICAGTVANKTSLGTEVTEVENDPEITNSVTDSNNKPVVRMENVAKLQLVNLELMPKLAPRENHPKRLPYLYMKVSEKFDNIDEEPKSAIVGAIHNLMRRDSVQKQKESSKESERGYRCTVCGQKFDLWRAWRAHEREHRLGTVPQCKTCNKVFKNENSLRFHMRRHLLGAPTKRYMCQTCEKTFYSRAAATDHTRIHTGERPFVCATCGKAFTRKFALKMHHRSHLRTREPKALQPKFVCATCGAEMATESAWKAHVKLHLEETSYECRTCHKGFSTIGSFKSHVRKCGKFTTS